jgi:hypothetical protein
MKKNSSIIINIYVTIVRFYRVIVKKNIIELIFYKK